MEIYPNKVLLVQYKMHNNLIMVRLNDDKDVDLVKVKVNNKRRRKKEIKIIITKKQNK